MAKRTGVDDLAGLLSFPAPDPAPRKRKPSKLTPKCHGCGKFLSQDEDGEWWCYDCGREGS